jgi:hypothetical protein
MPADAERARALLERLDGLGASLRLRGGKLVLRGASRLPADLREAVRRERAALVEAVLERERWARATTDRERR